MTTTPDVLTPLLAGLRALVTTGAVDGIEANQDMILISLNPDHPEKSRTMRAWQTYLHPSELISHQRSSNAPEVRLNLRGAAPGGECVVVYMTFQRKTEQTEVDAIKEMIHSPVLLLDSLAAMEQGRTQNNSALAESGDLDCEP